MAGSATDEDEPREAVPSGHEPAAAGPVGEPPALGGRYARYVLGVLMVVYTFNFLDRQILAILANDLRADLGLDDAQLGFLYGTAFAVFYAVFGIPLGRLADVWNRRSLIAIGLGFWSVMTALSGLARSFVQLAIPRIGVGVGEASASPSAYSMLSDYFPPAKRATALALYSSGIYIGAGLGLIIGGQIAGRWDAAWTSPPLGLRGWQVAFFAVGLPGLLLALWVRSLREPVRGQADGLIAPPEPHPLRAFLYELRSVLPPLTLYHLVRAGGGLRALRINLAIVVIIAAATLALVHGTGDVAQWVAFGAGIYASASWVQAVGLRDRPTHALVFGTRSLRYATFGFAFLAFTGYGVGFWVVPYIGRTYAVNVTDLGLWTGLGASVGGWLGVVLGGVLADRLRARWPSGRLYVGVITALAPIPFVLWLLQTESLTVAYGLNFFVAMLTPMWVGAGAATVQELVLPRMRASASAFFLLVITFVGLALGPYLIGKLSVATGSLRTALLLGPLANLPALVLFWLSARTMAQEQRTVLERARASGETGI
ncbi:MAG: MFS transporter [Myxococcales bacterium]|nr:MFS transporter [Myxococcales bacterium]